MYHKISINQERIPKIVYRVIMRDNKVMILYCVNRENCYRNTGFTDVFVTKGVYLLRTNIVVICAHVNMPVVS